MDQKKEHIIEIGRKLFTEKGYLNTSMQDIAEAGNISKTTLYKLFHSKEELSLVIICYMNDQMRSNVEHLMERGDLPPLQMLKACISERLNGLSNRMRFMDEFIFAQSSEQREKYFIYINKINFDSFILFHRIIKHVFALADDALAGELTLTLTGLLKEISYIDWSSQAGLDQEAAVDYITDSLQATLEARRGKNTFLTPEILARAHEAHAHNMENLKPVFQKKRLMCDLKTALADYEKAGSDDKLAEAERILHQLKSLQSNIKHKE